MSYQLMMVQTRYPYAYVKKKSSDIQGPGNSAFSKPYEHRKGIFLENYIRRSLRT